MPHDDHRPAAVVAILAGGRSRRMGVPKAGVPLDGRSLLHHAAAAARAAGLRPVVVAKTGSSLPDVAGLERWDEPDGPTHPLTGVAAALRRADAPVVVLPVDLPRVPAALLAHLAARPEPLVVVEGAGRLHPLLARVAPEHAAALAAAAAAGAPVVRTVLGLGAVVAGDAVLAPMGDPAVLLANINRPDDLANLGWTDVLSRRRAPSVPGLSARDRRRPPPPRRGRSRAAVRRPYEPPRRLLALRPPSSRVVPGERGTHVRVGAHPRLCVEARLFLRQPVS